MPAVAVEGDAVQTSDSTPPSSSSEEVRRTLSSSSEAITHLDETAQADETRGSQSLKLETADLHPVEEEKHAQVPADSGSGSDQEGGDGVGPDPVPLDPIKEGAGKPSTQAEEPDAGPSPSPPGTGEKDRAARETPHEPPPESPVKGQEKPAQGTISVKDRELRDKISETKAAKAASSDEQVPDADPKVEAEPEKKAEDSKGTSASTAGESSWLSWVLSLCGLVAACGLWRYLMIPAKRTFCGLSY